MKHRHNLLIEIKSFPKKIPCTPLIDNKFLTNSLFDSSFICYFKGATIRNSLARQKFQRVWIWCNFSLNKHILYIVNNCRI